MSVQSEVSNTGPFAVKVYYGGVRLLPAPLIDWTVESEFNDTGVRTSNVNRLVLTSSVLILPSGSYEQLYIKQRDLRNLFSTDYLDLVILAGNGNKTLPEDTIIASGLRPKVVSLNISPDIHVSRFDYSIELEDTIAVSGVSGITSSLTNSWSFKEDQDSCTLQVTHQISAEGPDGEPDKFEQAFRAVQALIGIDKLPLQIPYFTQPNFSGLFGMTHPSNPAGGPVFEVSVQREESADLNNGSYQVTEIFTIVSGVPFYFTQRTQSYDEDVNGVATVTVAGTVQGLGRTLVGGQPFNNLGYPRALSGFVNHVRPQIPYDASGVYVKYKQPPGVSGLVLNNPTSVSISQNECRGSITFSFSYTDDVAAILPSGIATKSCNINITEGIRLITSHAIPYRRLGNVLQDIETTTESNVSIQCQAKAKNTGNPTADLNRAIVFVQDELNRLKNKHGNPANFVNIRIGGLNQQINESDLTCSASLDLIGTVDLATVPSINSNISLRTI